MDSLPLLPGYCFNETRDYSLKQKLKFRNGFRMVSVDWDVDQSCNPDDCECRLVEYDPTLTYGRPRNRPEIKRFLPHYVLFDQKTLRLDAYFKQGIFGSSDEHYRVRHVRILYYLEDDTMAVMERPILNSGLPQGKLVRRDRIPRPDKPGACYHWKDLQIGTDMEIYSVVYRIYNCDSYTREFLESQGIIVGEPEPAPIDPYLQERALKEQLAKPAPKGTSGTKVDRRLMHLEYAGLALTFDALWEGQSYRLIYFLDDNTVTLVENQQPGEARAKPLLRKYKVPKDWRELPAAYFERTDDDVSEYYSPGDFKVGETVFIFGRRLLLTDCDGFSRKYYAEILGTPQPEALNLPKPGDDCKPSCRINTERLKRNKDTLRRIYNFPKRLRYSLIMEAVRPEDENREFVLEYNLADCCMRISELARRNSGRCSGRFLAWNKVPKKPGDETSEYYTPEDFEIGGKLCIFGHWFIITGTEPYVYKYMQANPDKFDEKLRRNVEDYLRRNKLIEGGEKWPCDEEGVECNCSEGECEKKEEEKIDKRIETLAVEPIQKVKWPCEKEGVKCDCSDDEEEKKGEEGKWPCDAEGVECHCSDDGEDGGKSKWPCDEEGVKCDCSDEGDDEK